ncbi:beta-N-acetylglucosaminidase domain-containing protein [Streptomyces canus]|uniref:beta-N-acetylglucosaminidase domain-containing protein n=1 Tax=Streptomyces canus TaxID=58343 RepID=UPI0036EAD5B2
MDSFIHLRCMAAALLLALGLAAPATPASAEPRQPVPEVWPAPQRMAVGPGRLPVPDRVVEAVGRGTDPSARRVVEAALKTAGADRVTRVDAGDRPPPSGLTAYVGGSGENTATARALTRLGAASPSGLASGGYVLASGRSHGQGLPALSGVDTTGTCYAAQTLRQLRGTANELPVLTVRDWPTAALRGVIEGFYGTPCTHAERLAQLDFYGRTKQNVYVYSPKDDDYLRARWRDEYPAAALARLKELVDRAGADHVRFTYALSPGLSVCYTKWNCPAGTSGSSARAEVRPGPRRPVC